MQKILVPTDFSKLSENALALAVDIGRRTDSEVFLVHFMEHPFGATFSTTGEVSSGDTESDLFTLQLARKNHQRLHAIAEKHGVSVKVQFQVYDQDFDEGFKKYIREQAIDLAVIATSGEESAEEFFTGNNTEKMIKEATCPVISIKDGYEFNNFKNIVVGIDLEHDEDDNYIQAANLLNTFAKNVGGHLHLVHIIDLNDDKAAAEKEVRAFVKKYKFEDYTLSITQNDDKEQGLISYGFGTGASMLAILTHAESGLLSLFTKSMAEELSKRSSIPVMAINLHHV